MTPNLAEAAALVGHELTDVEAAQGAARELAGEGRAWVVVKGGHLRGPATDTVAHGDEVVALTSDRVDTVNVHGTGCSFASAVAAGLARGEDHLAAIQGAKAFIDRGVRGGAGWRLGAGHGPIDHFGWSSR